MGIAAASLARLFEPFLYDERKWHWLGAIGVKGIVDRPSRRDRGALHRRPGTTFTVKHPFEWWARYIGHISQRVQMDRDTEILAIEHSVYLVMYSASVSLHLCSVIVPQASLMWGRRSLI